MENNLIANSIVKEELQLDSFEKFKYFKVSILCFIISSISFTEGFHNFITLDFNEISAKVGVFFLILGIILFLAKLKRLKLIVVEDSITNSREELLFLSEERKWEIELNSEKALIFRTIPIRGFHEYFDYHNKHEGERIYIFFSHRKILIKSIHNLDNFSIKIENGQNGAIERAIVSRISLK